MSEMVERVAEAVRLVAAEVHIGLAGDQASIIARTAIAAMREPTDAVVSALAAAEGPFRGAQRDAIGRDWRKMIDAALAEEGR